MKIKAAVVREKSGPFILEEVELDEPREDEVLVRIVGSGICHTDLMARDQYIEVPLPGVFGHEGSGIVERVGSRVKKVRAGDHVVLSFLSCGACPSCLKGIPTRCSIYFTCNLGGSRVDGSPTMHKDGEIIHANFVGQSSFASYSLANERNVVKVCKDAPLEILGPLSCAVQTGAGAVMNTLRAEASSSIVVFGTGPVGLSAVLAADVAFCSPIIAVDINSERLRLAQEFGATHIINPRETDPVQEVLNITKTGINYSLECTGIPAVLRNAVDVLAMGGVCGMIGVPPADVEVSLNMRHILDGRRITGIIVGDSIGDIFIPQVVDLYMKGRLPFDRMIKLYPFDQINQAVKDSEEGRTIKAVLRP